MLVLGWGVGVWGRGRVWRLLHTFSLSKLSNFLFSDWRVFIVTAAGEEGGRLGDGATGGFAGGEERAAKSTSSSSSLSLKVNEDDEASGVEGFCWASFSLASGRVEPGLPSNSALRCLARSSFAASSPPAGILWGGRRG